jgi:hypothetical protein
LGKSKKSKSKAIYWITGKKKARVITDGHWIDVVLPKKRRIRIEVTEALRKAIRDADVGGADDGGAIPCTFGLGELDPELEKKHRRKGGKKEGSVTFESFEYEDQIGTNQVYVLGKGWQRAPAPPPPGTTIPEEEKVKYVVQTRVVKPSGQLLVAGQPNPPVGSYIRSAKKGVGSSLENSL